MIRKHWISSHIEGNEGKDASDDEATGNQRGAKDDKEAGCQLRRKTMTNLHFEEDKSLNLEAPDAPAPLRRPGAARSADVGGDQASHHKVGRHLRDVTADQNSEQSRSQIKQKLAVDQISVPTFMRR